MRRVARIGTGWCLATTLLLAVGPLRAEPFDLGPIPLPQIECLAVSGGAGTLAPDPALDGAWRQWRRDSPRTGRSPLVGEITCPEVLWTYDLGARVHFISLRPGRGTVTMPLPGVGQDGNNVTDGIVFEFQLGGPSIDLDGNGEVQVTNHDHGRHRVGEFLPEVEGVERVSCDDKVGPRRCYLEHRVGGQWQTEWISADLPNFERGLGRGNPIVGDFDNDGTLEAAVLPWHEVHVLDLATGALEQTATFTEPGNAGNASGRAYGWFGAFDLGGDARQEFVILGDFENFISVLGWVGGDLVELWERRIDTGIFELRTMHRTGANPVTDVDGDGAPEITTSVYNESGDGRWHVMVFDGMTGAVEWDLPDRYLRGLADIDGDGSSELFLITTSGRTLPTHGESEVRSLAGGVPQTLWTSSTESFELVDVPGLPDHVNSWAVRFRESAFVREGWIDGPPVFVTRERAANGIDVTLRLYQWNGVAVAPLADASGPRLALVSLPVGSPERGLLIQATTESPEEAPLTTTGVLPRLEATGRVDNALGGILSRAPAVGRLDAAGDPVVVVQDYGQQIRALAVSPEQVVTERWRAPGRGEWDAKYPLLADLTGTGAHAVVVGGEGPGGEGAIRALDASGGVLWEATFDILGEPPGSAEGNEGGVYRWMSGRFTAPDREDVLVSVGGGNFHTSDVYLLDGETGDVTWFQDTTGRYSACDPAPVSGLGLQLMPTLDWDGDGLDEFLGTFSSNFSIHDGNDGALLLNRWFKDDCPSAQSILPGRDLLLSPRTAIVDVGGEERILVGANNTLMLLLEPDGDLVWEDPDALGSDPAALQGIGDMDGNGDLEIVAVGNCSLAGQEIRVLDAATGILEWSLAFPGCGGGSGDPLRSVVTGDLDGDGRDEALFVKDEVLYAFGLAANGEGEFLWRVSFDAARPEPLSEVTIADVDGSGRPQILVSDLHGWLYALGTPAVDRCPGITNHPQTDTDGDGAGDACDDDDDGDGVPDVDDDLPLDDSDSVDTDGDGRGDASDTDDDGDGVTDLLDPFPHDPERSTAADDGASGGVLPAYRIVRDPGFPVVTGLKNFVPMAQTDLDDDGFDDLVYGRESRDGTGPATDVFLLGNGDGTYRDGAAPLGIAPPATTGPQGVTADFNDDGVADVAIFDDRNPNGSFNTGSPPVLLLSDVATGAHAVSGALADAVEAWYQAEVFPIEGFTSRGLFTRRVVAGDVDNDGDPDLFVRTSFGNEAFDGSSQRLGSHVMVNNGDGTFTVDDYHGGAVDLAGHFLATLLNDLDGDGYADLVLGHDERFHEEDVVESLVIYNDGEAGLTGVNTVQLPEPPYADGWSYVSAAAAGDLDGDGDVDLVFQHVDSRDRLGRYLQVLIADGQRGFADRTVELLGMQTDEIAKQNPAGIDGKNFNNSFDLRLLDLDHDGDLDIVVAQTNFGPGWSPFVYLNDGDGRFDPMPNSVIGTDMGGPVPLDANGDGLIDFVGTDPGGTPGADEQYGTDDDANLLVTALAIPRPVVTAPQENAVLDGHTQVFGVSDSQNALRRWELWLGTVRGGRDLGRIRLRRGATSVTASRLPTAGGEVWVRLRYLIGRRWSHRDYRYEARNFTRPGLAGPVPGASLSSAGETLLLEDGGNDVGQWRLDFGTTPGGRDLNRVLRRRSFRAGDVAVDVTGLPDDTLTFVRAHYRIGRSPWRWVDVVYNVDATVRPVYASAGDFMDHVRNDGPDPYTARGRACSGRERGGYGACVHAGAMRQVFLPEGTAGCDGISAQDNAGVFEWMCLEDTQPPRVVSSAFAPGKGLRDLILPGALAWREMSLTVFSEGGAVVGPTAPTAWWSDALVDADSAPTLQERGTVYVIRSATPASNYRVVRALGVAVVVDPGLGQVEGAPGAGEAVVLVSRSRLVRVEGTFAAAGLTHGVRVESSTFTLLHGVSVKGADAELPLRRSILEPSGIYMLRSSNSRLDDVEIHDTDGTGLLIERSSWNWISGFATVGSTDAGIRLESASRNTLEDGVSVDNGGDGLLFNGSSRDNRVWRVRFSNNGRDGVRLNGSRVQRAHLDHLTVHNNEGDGVGVIGARQTLSRRLTLAGNGGSGLRVADAQDGLYEAVASLNNGLDGVTLSGRERRNRFFGTVVAHNAGAGVRRQAPKTDFSGVLKSGANLAGNCVFESVGSDDCEALLGDGAVLRLGVTGAASFVGKLSDDDPVNLEAGTAQAANAIGDWSHFENGLRGWGRDGVGLLDPAQRGRCVDGDPCRIWDYRLASGDRGDAGSATMAEALGVSPAVATLTHPTNRRTRFAAALHEVLDDGIGDDDGLCERSEACVLMTSVGSFAGDGTLEAALDTPVDSGGGISGVRVLQFERNSIP